LTLSYIGPVRERLHRYNEIEGALPYSVGPNGKFAPEIFRRMARPEKEKVVEWIRRFNIGSDIKIEKNGDDMFALMIASEKEQSRYYNVADTGFGVSQVLPLIMQAVASDASGPAAVTKITIAEQPEIHLNPMLQSTLADLFVEIASREDQRVIVETHSEHLVLRLRRLIAEKRISSSDVGLLFVEQHRRESKIREVPISDLGHIEGDDWPNGFFESSLQESIALADAQISATKKKARR
jgi:predicted ATPase